MKQAKTRNPFNWKVVKGMLLEEARRRRPGHEFTRVDPALRVEGGYLQQCLEKAIVDLVQRQPSKGRTIRE